MKNYALNKLVGVELQLNSFADVHTEMAAGIHWAAKARCFPDPFSTW